jgi:hypothetical protein
MPALFIRIVEPIRRRLDWTAPKTWCGRGARSLQLEEQPAAAL